MYDTLFGGVVIFTKEQFWKVNGYSNLYFGWGVEDDDLFIRYTHHLVTSNYRILRSHISHDHAVYMALRIWIILRCGTVPCSPGGS